MATSTTITLLPFDENKALNGALLAFSSGGAVKDYVFNFKLANTGSYVTRYSGEVNKTTYYFNKDGECSDGNSAHQLYIVDAEFSDTKGTAATRFEGGVEESIYVDILQPREQFAIAALQGILSKIDNPLNLSNSQISYVAELSFKIAQSMMSTAADYRAATKPEETPPAVDVDINNVTSTTDKLLYNLSQSLSGMQTSLKDIKNSMTGDKAQKVEISNQPLKVNVENFPENLIYELEQDETN